MKDDAKFKNSLSLLQKHGPIGLTKLAELAGESRVTIRRRMEFCEFQALAVADRSASPIQFKTVDGWEEKYKVYTDKRDRALSERGKRLQTLYPCGALSGRHKVVRISARDKASENFPEILAACIAMRPDVRTTWREPAPQWGAA